MKFKKLNNTNCSLPVIGQGCLGLGSDFSFEFYEESINVAIDNGITLFDTAEVYGDGLSEETLGKIICGKREKVQICTKICPQISFGKNFIISAEKSLKRLRTDYIDIYQIHWPNYGDDMDDVVRNYEKLIKDGKILYVGLSNFYAYDMIQFFKLKCSFDVVSNQLEYNLFDRTIEKDTLDVCKDHNLTILAYSPLCRGRMLNNSIYMDILERIANKYKKTPAQVVLNWLALQENVCPIPCSFSKKHIIENANSVSFDLDSEDIYLINTHIRTKVKYIDFNNINVIEEGFGGHKVYTTIKEAEENIYNFCPGPKDMVKNILAVYNSDIGSIKPIRVTKNSDNTYNIIEGRIRFWAWSIAFDRQKPVPALVID